MAAIQTRNRAGAGFALRLMAAAAILSGCDGLLPTATLAPEAATEAVQATMTKDTPSAILRTATATIMLPTPTVTISPFDLTPISLVDPNTVYPEAEIQIYRPGAFSKVVSPFRLVGNLTPGPGRKVHVDLVGEDGRLLSRQLLTVPVPPGHDRVNFVTDMSFEIPGVSELGRVEVSVEDDYGRVKALSSVDVILLSTGLEDLNTYGDLQQNIVIQQPRSNFMIAGGVLYVTGLARAAGEPLLVVELITREGKIVGSGLATLVAPEDSLYGLFAGEIEYAVSEPTWVLVVVRARGARIPGTAELASLEVVVSP